MDTACRCASCGTVTLAGWEICPKCSRDAQILSRDELAAEVIRLRLRNRQLTRQLSGRGTCSNCAHRRAGGVFDWCSRTKKAVSPADDCSQWRGIR